MIKITPVLCLPGSMNNYSYIITDEETGTSAIIDPADAAPIIERCGELGVTPSYILNTHHHFDHTDANLELKKFYKAQVVGNAQDASRIPGFDIGVEDGGSFMLGSSKAEIIQTDGHTIGHILWYFPDSKTVFTGDMLFNLCIGGLFEGSIDQMWNSVQKVKSLPDDTLFYPGHEYTMYGAKDALTFSHNSPEVINYLKNAEARIKKGLPAGPISLKVEKICNPYLAAPNKEAFARVLNA